MAIRSVGRSRSHRWTESSGRGKSIVVAAVTLVVVAAGLLEIVLVVRDARAPHPVASANLDGLTAAVQRAGWLGMDMAGPTSGYQMPAAMMPGAPAEGDERLAITITVANTGGGTRPVHVAQEFSLRGPDGQRWTPQATTFGDLPRLGPDNAITGELYFDLPEADVAKYSQSSIWVEWNYQGGRSQLEIPALGDSPVHTHPS
jgi:hypothetical protein